MLDSRWAEILENDELLKKMSDATGPEEIQMILKDYGYTFTLEEIYTAGEELSALEEGELNEGDLEDVAGGVRRSLSTRIIKGIKNMMQQLKQYGR